MFVFGIRFGISLSLHHFLSINITGHPRVFSFQLFEAGKVEDAALLAAHSPKVISTLTS